MVNEPLDFRRTIQLLRHHKIIVLAAVLVGLVGGTLFAVLRPVMLTSEAWVVLPPSVGASVGTQLDGTQQLGTQVVIARSDAVLIRALHDINAVHPEMSLQALRDSVGVKARTDTIMVISGSNRNAALAQDIAEAVVRSYVGYVGQPGNLPGGAVQARILQHATTATGANPSSRLVATGLLGGLLAGILVAVGILAATRRDRRLLERDAIANSIGVPVLASINVDRPSDARGWRQLLEKYAPGAVDAWRMRMALRYMGVGEHTQRGQKGPRGSAVSLAVITASFDRKAVALGPQVAVFAASRGIPTTLVVGPDQNLAATATLRAACTAGPSQPSSLLRVVVRDQVDAIQEPSAGLTVVVCVVDGDVAQDTRQIRTTAAVLGVSAGAATAEQLARLAASAATAGHDVIGILLADPDPADTTTGRMPQVERPAQRRYPTRTNGTTMGFSG